MHKHRQELCCNHGNFPDCDRVNASPAPAAFAFGPSVAFVCVGDASLFDGKGSLKVGEQKADCAAAHQRSQTDHTQNHTHTQRPKRASAARNTRARAARRERIR